MRTPTAVGATIGCVTGESQAARIEDASTDQPLGESRWPPAIAILVFMGLNIALRVWLPHEGAVRIVWLVPALEALLVVVLVFGDTGNLAAVPLGLLAGPLARLVGGPCCRHRREREQHRRHELQPPRADRRAGWSSFAQVVDSPAGARPVAADGKGSSPRMRARKT
jgi:hypothetical protein